MKFAVRIMPDRQLISTGIDFRSNVFNFSGMSTADYAVVLRNRLIQKSRNQKQK